MTDKPSDDMHGGVAPPTAEGNNNSVYKTESVDAPTPPSREPMYPVFPTLSPTPESCTKYNRGQAVMYKVQEPEPEIAPTQKACTTTVGADLDLLNILTSYTHSRWSVYLADIKKPLQINSVHAVFAAGQQQACQKLHCDKLPPVPSNWTNIQSHPLCADFMDTATKKYKALVCWGVFQPVNHWTTSSKPLSLKWVFTYKFDTDRFLQKFKAWICVCGDLQRKLLYKDNYAVTLAAKMFQMLMAITAVFDLEAH